MRFAAEASIKKWPSLFSVVVLTIFSVLWLAQEDISMVCSKHVTNAICTVTVHFLSVITVNIFKRRWQENAIELNIIKRS